MVGPAYWFHGTKMVGIQLAIGTDRESTYHALVWVDLKKRPQVHDFDKGSEIWSL